MVRYGAGWVWECVLDQINTRIRRPWKVVQLHLANTTTPSKKDLCMLDFLSSETYMVCTSLGLRTFDLGCIYTASSAAGRDLRAFGFTGLMSRGWPRKWK